MRTYAGARSRVTLPTLVLLSSALLAGCGGSGDDAEATTSPSAPSSSTAPTSASPSTSTSTETSAAPSSSADGEAAGGGEVVMRSFTASLPEGFVLSKALDPESNAAFDPDEQVGTVFYDSFEDLGDLGMEFHLDIEREQVTQQLGRAPEESKRTVGGVEGVVLSGDTATLHPLYEFLALDGDWFIRIKFEVKTELDDPQAFIDSVLDSVQYVTPPAS